VVPILFRPRHRRLYSTGRRHNPGNSRHNPANSNHQRRPAGNCLGQQLQQWLRPENLRYSYAWVAGPQLGQPHPASLHRFNGQRNSDLSD